MTKKELSLLSFTPSAIHLYEKHGFLHDPETMARFGGEYDRADVAMRYVAPHR